MSNKRLNIPLSDEHHEKLQKISKELLGEVNKTSAVRILINQYRLENETNNK